MKRTRTKPFSAALDALERRMMLDGDPTTDTTILNTPAAKQITPEVVRSYYGAEQLQVGGAPATGQGQTIVIINNRYDPSYANSDSAQWATSGLALYSQQMGLPSNAAGTDSDFKFTILNQDGGTDLSGLSGVRDVNFGEFDEDSQAVHMMAPRANIDVIIPNSLGNSADMKQAYATALSLKPAAITVSYSTSEDRTNTSTLYVDGNGTTYIRSAGDAGAGLQYTYTVDQKIKGGRVQADVVAGDAAVAAESKAKHHPGGHKSQSKKHHKGGSSTSTPGATTSGTKATTQPAAVLKTHETQMLLPMTQINPLEVMAGGTVLAAGSGTTPTETAWGNGAYSYLGRTDGKKFKGGAGGGGGYSLFNPRPLDQVQSPAVQLAEGQGNIPKVAAGMRLGPDISLMSEPGIAKLTYGIQKGQQGHYWSPSAGTSLSAPLFAGIMALVGQGRSLAGRPALSSSDTLNFLYQAPGADYHDITSGNNGYAAAPGFDLATGLGTPTAALLGDLVAATYPTTTAVATVAPTTLAGAPVTLTARVAPSFGARIPDGTVTFTDAGQVVGTATLDAGGRAFLTYTPSGVGTHAISASYAPPTGSTPSSFFAASASAAGSYAVAAVPTTTTLAPLPADPVQGNQPIPLTAQVATTAGDAAPGGTVSFYDNGQLVGRQPLDATGRAALVDRAATLGAHAILATYSGGPDDAPSSSAVAAVATTAAPTTTTLAVAPGATLAANQAITLTATVAVPAGATLADETVSFYDNGTLLHTATLGAGGRATFAFTPHAPGLHSLLATFNGSDLFGKSISPFVATTVTPA